MEPSGVSQEVDQYLFLVSQATSCTDSKIFPFQVFSALIIYMKKICRQSGSYICWFLRQEKPMAPTDLLDDKKTWLFHVGPQLTFSMFISSALQLYERSRWCFINRCLFVCLSPASSQSLNGAELSPWVTQVHCEYFSENPSALWVFLRVTQVLGPLRACWGVRSSTIFKCRDLVFVLFSKEVETLHPNWQRNTQKESGGYPRF